jgi:hypothetical protein
MVSVNPPQADEIIAYEADKTIRGLIGKDTNLADIFTQERIDACQNSIDNARDAFFDSVGNDLAVLELLVRVDAQNASAREQICEAIAAPAANIKGHADLFGFKLIAKISAHILANCASHAHDPDVQLRIIADLIKMLRVSVNQKICGDGGALAQELDASLKKEGA